MAGLFSRILRLGKSEAHSLIDKIEDPIKLTEQGIRDLKKDLQQSMQSLAQVKGIVIRMRNEAENQKKLAADYERKAMALLQKGQQGALDAAEAERLATEALAKKEDSSQKALRTSQDLMNQEKMVNQLQKNVDKLRSTVQRYENDLVTLRARAKTAAATRKLNEQIAKVDSGGTIAMLEKMKAKVEEDESLAEAYGDIIDTDQGVDDQINKALEAGTGSSPAVSDSLAALKAKMKIS
ncbi:MAG: PspA/IM30 family protein [Nitrospinales bacterium]